MAVNDTVIIKGHPFTVLAEFQVARPGRVHTVQLLKTTVSSVPYYMVARNGFIQLFSNACNVTADLVEARYGLMDVISSLDIE